MASMLVATHHWIKFLKKDFQYYIILLKQSLLSYYISYETSGGGLGAIDWNDKLFSNTAIDWLCMDDITSKGLYTV